MATKAELESERQHCHAIAMQAVATVRSGRYAEAVAVALQSLPYLAGAMQYDKRYLKIENPPVPSLEVIFRCAPPLFLCEALDHVEAFIDLEKRASKTAAIDVTAELAAARGRMALAGRLWGEIESGNYGDEAARRPSTADESAIRNLWVEIGLLVPFHAGGLPAWAFRTQLNEELQARCFGCGRRVQGKKFKFLEAGRCPRCQTTTHFAILPPKQQGSSSL